MSVTNPDKVCSGCENPKTLEAFPPDARTKDGRGSKCRVCATEVKRAFYSKYPEAEAQRRLKNAIHGSNWYQRNRDRETARTRGNRLIRVYGITPEEYDEILKQQDNACAICKTTDPGRKDNYFAVDHDHDTGDIRGLLCQRCNCGIGFLSDDPNRIRRAADYVEHSRRQRPHKPTPLQAA